MASPITVEFCDGSRRYSANVEQGGHVSFGIDGRKSGNARWVPRFGLYYIPPAISRRVYSELEKLIIEEFRRRPGGF